MSPAFAGRRSADRFDALVGDPTARADDPRLGELLDVVGALRSTPAPSPRPDFSAALRERLMAEADTVLLPRDRTVDDRLTLPVRSARTRRDRRLAVAAGTLAVVGASTSMAMAAQTALPGDALYPVKRALEDARTGVSVGDGARGSVLLASAAGRLDELTELARRDATPDDGAAEATLEAFVEQTEEASALLIDDYTGSGDVTSITELRDFTATSVVELGRVDALLRGELREELRAAADLLAEIDATAARLCPTCGSGVTSVPLTLLGAGSTPLEEMVSPVRHLEPPAAQPARSRTPDDGPDGGAAAGGSSQAAGQPMPELPAPGTVQGPGSVFVPPTTGGGGTGGAGGDGFRGLLTGSTTASGSTGGAGGGTGGGALGPVTEPLAPVLEPLAPVVDPVTGLVDGALGGGLTGGD